MLGARLNRSAQISLITAAVLGGVLVSRLWPEGIWYVGAGAWVTALPLLGWRWTLCLILLLWFGVWRGATTSFDHTLLSQYIDQKVTIVGVIDDDPAVNDKNRTVFKVKLRSLNGQPADQVVYVQTTNKPLQRGYTVAINGKLTPGIGSLPAELFFGQVSVLSTQTGWLEHVRQSFFTGVRAELPDPLAGFGLGLLIGLRALISKPLQQTLNAVGLSHLIAVSGYNLTILIQAGRRLITRVSTFTATATSLWLITGFLLVTGFSASIVRAALVSGLSLWTSYYGYEIAPLSLVCIPALVTVIWNPDYLISDVGWQLSFLAFFGIIVIAPLIEKRWRRPNAIRSLVMESLAAQVMTAPLIFAIFGNFSVIAPLANAVILPLVPLAMLLSFLTGVMAIAVPFLAGWVALPTAGLLGLTVGVIQWFATWPYANLQLKSTAGTVAAMSGLVGLVVVILWVRARQANDRSFY